jgi:branched-chain amino acid transport system ATP-binding protein
MLQIRNLQCGYEDIVAVHDLSFEAAAGEVFALIGANGAGKTTTIMALAGHVVPMRGSILVEGQDISSEKAQGRLSHGIALVPEGRRVFPDLSVENNLTVGGHTVGREALRSNRENAYQIFPRLAERRTQLAGSLSGGEQQMLAIARAMMASPKILLVDELSLGLMPKMVDECYQVVDTLKQQGLLIVLVEQSTQRALEVADQVAVLESGRLAWYGSGESARRDSSIVSAYLGA